MNDGYHTGSRIKPAVKKRALRLRWENPKWGAERIRKILKKEYPNERIPSKRQIHRWIKDVPMPTERDGPWAFSQNEKAEVPWEATPLLTRLALDHADQLTNRVATWCWRLHTATTTLSDDDVFSLGKDYGDREWLAEVLNIDAYFEDLDSLLTYQPWSSVESYDRYVDAVKEGLIVGDIGKGAFENETEEHAFRLAQENGTLPRVPEIWRFTKLQLQR